jgi:hypothetical protein
VRDEQGRAQEIVRTDKGIELTMGCYLPRLHYSGDVALSPAVLDLETQDALMALPVHTGYWACRDYSCTMHNGNMDDLIMTVDRQTITYQLANDSKISVTYDFRSLRPMLRQLREDCQAP